MASPNQYEAPPKDYQKMVLCGEKTPEGAWEEGGGWRVVEGGCVGGGRRVEGG
jgi:hypothetical protein